MAKALKLSDNEYFNSDYSKYLSKSRLWKFRQDPVSLFTDQDDFDENKQHFVIGSALHTLALEGEDVYVERYTVLECINPKTKRSYGRTSKVFLSACADKELIPAFVLTPDDDAQIRKMYKAIKEHFSASGYIDMCEHVETVLRGTFEGIPAQGKLDGLSEPYNLIIDIKTCRSIDLFIRNYLVYGYDWQAILYADLYEQCYGSDPDFYFIAVSNDDVPEVMTIEATNMFKPEREEDMRRTAKIYQRCIDQQDYRLALFELGDM